MIKAVEPMKTLFWDLNPSFLILTQSFLVNSGARLHRQHVCRILNANLGFVSRRFL